MLPVFLAAIYGGYFGAGLSVIVLAVLGWCWKTPYPAERPEADHLFLRQYRGRHLLPVFRKWSGRRPW